MNRVAGEQNSAYEALRHFPSSHVAQPQLPPPVRAGDRVGVAALSGPLDSDRLARGLRSLQQIGFEPVLASNLESCCDDGLFAGDDEERLSAFHDLAADPSLKAIFFARGGHGLLRLLPRLDFDLLARHPRAYVGYSDLTPFLNLIADRLGIVTFHGPMVATDLDRGLEAEETRVLTAALAGEYPMRLPVQVCRGGDCDAVSGRLFGGCLSLLVATLGTPYFPRLDERILFVEDTNEPLYRLDRMLTHLQLSGNLNRIRALLLGHLEPEPAAPQAWSRVLETVATDRSWPTATGLAAGHGVPNMTIALGLHASLEEESLVLG